jgi:hypothetical protein
MINLVILKEIDKLFRRHAGEVNLTARAQEARLYFKETA